VIHIAFWTGVFYAINSLTSSFIKVQVNHNGMIMKKDVRQVTSPHSYLTIIFLMVLFYGNIFWIFKKALHYKKIISRLAAGFAWFALIFAANYLIVRSLLEQQHAAMPALEYSDPGLINDNQFTHLNTVVYDGMGGWLRIQLTMLLIFGSVTGLSVAYFFLKEWTRNELIRNQLEANQYSTEIKFLKSQINPHFLFNTLNNLFSMAQEKGNDELADGISKLSGMMRYMIYESNEETVPLKKEIEYLENCILLNKLRFADDEAKVIFNYPGQTESIFIAPMLFIPFVENAFKHGVVIGQSSQIDISISVSNKQLSFNCKNTIYSTRKMKDEKSGIGLENVRRRLDLVYPGKYKLTLKDNDAKYIVEIKLSME
jgi:two-component system, LytTR family, sensor kinase